MSFLHFKFILWLIENFAHDINFPIKGVTFYWQEWFAKMQWVTVSGSLTTNLIRRYFEVAKVNASIFSHIISNQSNFPGLYSLYLWVIILFRVFLQLRPVAKWWKSYSASLSGLANGKWAHFEKQLSVLGWEESGTVNIITFEERVCNTDSIS